MKQKNLPSRKRQNKMSVGNRRQPSSMVDALLTGAIAKVKTEAEAEIAKVKAETDEVITKLEVRTKEKRRALTNTRAKDRPSAKVGALFLEAIAKQKAKSEAEIAEAIAKVKAEAKTKTDTDTKDGTKAQFKKAPAKPKTKSEAKTTKATAKVKAEAEEKAKTYTDTKAKPSSKVDALFSDAVAEQKAKPEAETAEAIAKVKAETEEKTKAHPDTTAEVKTKAAEEPGAYTDVIAKVRAEAEEPIADTDVTTKGKSEVEEALSADTDATAKVKSEVEEARAEQKRKSEAEASEAIARVKAEAIEAIAKVQAKAEEEAAVYTVTIAKVKAGEKSSTTVGSKDQPICETQRIPQSLKVLPAEYFLTDSESPLFGLLQNANISLSAQDIMQKELVWGSADDSVRQTFTKMQQYNASYVMVGHDGALEGIVSKSDITGATSPYLQPAFSRRRQFLDDATLQIRIRWIMSRPVYIISPQTSLEVIMRHMCQFRRLCLPVVDQQSKVLGLVTQANILQALLQLQSSPNVSTSVEIHQGQPASIHPPNDSTAQTTMTMEASPVYSQ